MKICQISDTHLGITTEGQLKVMLKKAAKEDFEVIVHCGDWCGKFMGWRTVRDTLRLIRKQFPDKPILATVGNHDYWCQENKRVRLIDPAGFPYYGMKRPGPEDFDSNLLKIREQFIEHNVHFLDEDGVWVHPNYPRVVFIGSSGWYTNPYPRTNDSRWMPIGIDGDTNRYILSRTEKALRRSEDAGLIGKFDQTWQTLVFVSHFPVINTGNDYKGAFEDFSWSASIGDYYQSEYGCRHFLCGHAHQLHKGPLRWECGPDYFRPAFQIIEV